jgi:hypothetical protein
MKTCAVSGFILTGAVILSGLSGERMERIRGSRFIIKKERREKERGRG